MVESLRELVGLVGFKPQYAVSWITEELMETGLDAGHRRVGRLMRALVVRALKMAIAVGTPPEGCIHHRDCGHHYWPHDDQKIPRQHAFKVSMSGKAIGVTMPPLSAAFYESARRALVETLFKTIKAKLIWRHP